MYHTTMGLEVYGEDQIRLLKKVGYQNMRDNQIGETDGISPEVAADIGFTPYDDLGRILNGKSNTREENISKIRESLV